MSGGIKNSELVLCFLTLSTSWAKNSTTWGGEKSLISSGENEPSSDSVAWENKIMNEKWIKALAKYVTLLLDLVSLFVRVLYNQIPNHHNSQT